MKVLRFADVAGLAAGKRVFMRADLNVSQDHSAAVEQHDGFGVSSDRGKRLVVNNG